MVNDIFTPDKIFYHKALGQWLDGGNPFPVTMEIDVCGDCNSHCPRCAGGELRGRLDDNTVHRLLIELSSNGTRAVIFTGGGEPTLHSSLPLYIENAARAGLRIGLITNGLDLSDNIVSVAMRDCDWVRVSLDAWDAASYAVSHGGSPEDYHSVVGNIHRLAQSKHRNATLGVGILVDNDAIAGIEAAGKMGATMSIDYLQFRPYYCGWFGDTSETICIDDYRREFIKANRHATSDYRVLDSADKFQRLADGDTDRHYQQCHGQQFCGVVTAMGDVALCCLFRGNQKYSLGNVNINTFAEIWNDERRQNILDKLNVNSCPPLCRCDALNERLEQFILNRPQHECFL